MERAQRLQCGEQTKTVRCPCKGLWTPQTSLTLEVLTQGRVVRTAVNATTVGGAAVMGATGVVVPELVKVQALYKLVPQEQQSVIVSRPERADYNAKLLWVTKSLKSHLCCGTSKENAPNWQLVATVTASTW